MVTDIMDILKLETECNFIVILVLNCMAQEKEPAWKIRNGADL